jgi:hypothetical protein
MKEERTHPDDVENDNLYVVKIPNEVEKLEISIYRDWNKAHKWHEILESAKIEHTIIHLDLVKAKIVDTAKFTYNEGTNNKH